jgi:hypothetical protein
MDLNSIKRTILAAVCVLALSSVNAVAQEIRSEISLQGTGSSQRTPTEMGFGNTRPTPVDSWLAIATTSIVGLQQRRTTDMTAIRRFISAGRELV